MSERRCDQCEFWRDLEYSEPPFAVDKGMCRRFPPFPEIEYKKNLYPSTGHLPITGAGFWCGEFRARMAAIKTESEKKEEEGSK